MKQIEVCTNCKGAGTSHYSYEPLNVQSFEPKRCAYCGGFGRLLVRNSDMPKIETQFKTLEEWLSKLPEECNIEKNGQFLYNKETNQFYYYESK